MSEIEYITKHIKGHQDDRIRLEELDRLAQLNVEMDYWPKEYWSERYATR